jgi:hypothetical protein
MPRPITEHFAKVLKAPLCNRMWSSGAVRSDGAIFLRCWDDEINNGVALLGSFYDHGHNGGVKRRKHIVSLRHPCMKSPSVFGNVCCEFNAVRRAADRRYGAGSAGKAQRKPGRGT